MTKRTCKTYDAKLKAKIALELIAEKKSIMEIAAEYNMPKSTILEWKEKLLNEAQELFIPIPPEDTGFLRLDFYVYGILKSE